MTSRVHVASLHFFIVNYEVKDLFPWEMLIKTVISCFRNVEKIWNSAQINLSSTLNLYRRYLFVATISTEKSTTESNRRRFGAKWHVTVPNSVTPIKPIVCKWIYMSPGWYCQMTHVYQIFIRIFVKLWFRDFFFKLMMKNAVFCRLAQQELN